MAERQLGTDPSDLTDTATKGYVDAAKNAFSATVGNGSLTSIPVVHDLGTMDVIVSVHLISTGEEVECDIVKTNGTTVTLTFATAPATNSLRVTVIGTAFGNGSPIPTSSLGITDAGATGRALIRSDTTADAQLALDLTGGVAAIQAGRRVVQTITGPASLDSVASKDYVILIDAGGAPILPTAVSNTSRYTLKNIHSTSKTVATTGGQTIDGVTPLTLLPGQTISLISNGTGWVGDDYLATATGKAVVTAADGAAARAAIGSPLFIDVAAAPYNVTPATADPEIKIQEAIDYAAANGIPEVIISRPGTYTVGLHPITGSTNIAAALWGYSNLKLTMKPGVVIKLKDNATLPVGCTQSQIISVKKPYTTNPADIKTNWSIEGGVIDGNAANQTTYTVLAAVFLGACQSSYVKDVLVKNIWGNAPGPPGETFSFEANYSRDIRFINCEADGSGSAYTATGFSADNSFGVTWDSCVAHNMGYGMGFTAWMSSSVSWSNCRAYGNAANGFNLERCQYATYSGCVSGGKSPVLSDDYTAMPSFPSGTTAVPNDTGFAIRGSSYVSVTGCVAENTTYDMRIASITQSWMVNEAQRVAICDNVLVSNCVFSNSAGYDSETILRGVFVESADTGGLDQTEIHIVNCSVPNGWNGALANFNYAPVMLWRTKNPSGSGVRFHTTGGIPGAPAFRWSTEELGSGTPILTLDSSGQVVTRGRRMTRRAVSADATVALTDEVIAVTNASAPRTITLPAAATAQAGATYLIQDESGTASNTNPIIVAAAGADLIEGVASKTIRMAYGQLRVISTGSAWVVDGLDSRNPFLDNPKMDGINASNGFRSVYIGADGDGSSYLSLVSNGSGSPPGIYAQSGDANTSINIGPKGSGKVNIYASTGYTPTIVGTGQDANHNLNLTAKGTGVVQANGVPVSTVTTGTRSSALNAKLRGGNITVKPGTNWRHLWSEWDWDNWIKPQVDRAIKLGLNAVRLIGGSRSIIDTIWFTAWAGSTAYAVDATRALGGKVYRCTVAGTSASSGGPTGTGSTIVDGTVTWEYFRDDNLTNPTQAQLDARWSQLAEYCLSNGLYLYPCLCTTEDFEAFGGGYQSVPGTASVVTSAGVLSKYPNVIGFDLFQEGSALTGRVWEPNTAYTNPYSYVNNGGKSYFCEVSGTSASSGGPTGTGASIVDGTVTWSYQGVPLLAADVLALMAKIRAVCNVPLTISAGGWGAGSIFWSGASYLWQLVHSDPAGSDFIDHHLYDSAITYGIVESYADLFGGKPTLIGEFGSGEDLSGGEQTARFTTVSAVHKRTGVMGSFVWALADQGLAPVKKYGVWNNTGFVQGSAPLSTTTGQKTALTGILRSFTVSQEISPLRFNKTLTGTSGTATALSINPTVTQSSTAGYTALSVNATQTTTGSGAAKLMSASVNGTEKFAVDNAGRVTLGSRITDLNGNAILGLSPQASAVNYLTVLNGVAGVGPQLWAEGSDTNATIYLTPKGTGSVAISSPSGVTPRITAIASTDANVGLSLSPKGTGAVLIPAGTGGLELYNTVDQTTNYEKVAFRFNSSVAEIAGLYGGTQPGRTMKFGLASAAGSNTLARFLQVQVGAPFLSFQWGATGVTGNITSVGAASTLTGSSGTQAALAIDPTCSQTGTANYTALLVNPTESGNTSTGAKLLADFQLGGVSKAKIDSTGAVSVSGTAAVWKSGTGTPEGAVTAPVGSMYTRTDGGANTTLYIKESGVGNTGWVAK